MNSFKGIVIAVICFIMGSGLSFSQTEVQNEEANQAFKEFTKLVDSANVFSDSAKHFLEVKADKKTTAQNKKNAKDLYGKAEKIYKDAVELNPNVYGVYYNLGMAQLKTEKYRSAIKTFDICKQLDTSKNDPYREQAMAWLGRGKLEKAKVDLDTAIDKNYDDVEAFYQRGLLKDRTNDKQGAIADFTRTVDLKKDFSPGYFRRGVIHYTVTKDYKFANHDLKKAIEFDSANIELFYWMGKIKFELNEFAEAEKSLSHYIDDSGDSLNIDALVTRGAARLNLNKYTQAVSDFNIVIEEDKKNYAAYTNRGLAKGCLKQYKEAMADLDKAVELKFDFSPIYINRALVKFAMRDKEGACKDLIKAQSLNNIKADDLIDQYCPK